METSGLTAQVMVVPAGETLLTEGSKEDVAYLVFRGPGVTLEREGRILGDVHPGEMVGCTAVLLQVPHHLTVRGRAPSGDETGVTFVKKYDGHQLRFAFTTDLELARWLWKGLDTEERLLQLGNVMAQDDPRERIALLRRLLRGKARSVASILGVATDDQG